MAVHPAPSEPAADDAPRVAPDFARPALERQMAGLARIGEIGVRIVERLDRASARYEAAAEAAWQAGLALRAAPVVQPLDPKSDDIDREDDDLDAVVADIATQTTAAPNNDNNAAATLPAVETAASLAYARAARGVRQTYALEMQVIEQLRRVERIEQSGVDNAAREVAARATARRGRVASIVTRIVADKADGDAGAYTRLCDEASERLCDLEIFGDILETPLSDAVALICRDLGLDPDWPGLFEESWAREELRSGLVGKALKALLDRDPDDEPLPPPRRRVRVPKVVIVEPAPPHAKSGASSSQPNVNFIYVDEDDGAPDAPEPTPEPPPPRDWSHDGGPAPTPYASPPYNPAPSSPPPRWPPPADPPPRAWTPPHEGPHVLPGELPPSDRPRTPNIPFGGHGGFMG